MKTTLPFIICLLTFLTQAQIDVNTQRNILPTNSNIGSNWTLDFSDEFNSQNLNQSKWTALTSSKSRAPRPNLSITDWWWRKENVSLKSGNLVLKVEKHDANTMYCGSINSKNKYESKYGYIEARIKIADATKGTHTALWLQGNNMGNIDGTGMDGAEIDVFESAWVGDFTKSVVHIDGYGAHHQSNTKRFDTPKIHQGYHIWGLHWTPNFMKIYYDGKLMVTYAAPLWIPQAKEYLWLSNGASFGFPVGSKNFIDAPIGFLTNAYVDYIRVWKEDTSANLSSCNVVHNNNFEHTYKQDFVWRTNHENTKLQATENPVVAGSKYGHLQGENASRFISQDVVVEPGLTYDFSFLGRIQNRNGNSGIYANNHPTKGAATLKGQILDGDKVLLNISTKSNKNNKVQGVVVIPEGVRVVTVKISKNWNMTYVDQVELMSSTSASCSTLSTGVNNNVVNTQKVIVSPNPTFNTATVSGLNTRYLVTVTDVMGRVVKTYNTASSALKVDLSNNPSGLYLVRFVNQDDNTSFCKKLIKQ